MFRPSAAGQGRTAGVALVNGTYDCPDAPTGKVKVFVLIQSPTGKVTTESDGHTFDEMASIIAEKYAGGIDLEIEGDNVRQDFDLEPAQDKT